MSLPESSLLFLLTLQKMFSLEKEADMPEQCLEVWCNLLLFSEKKTLRAEWVLF